MAAERSVGQSERWYVHYPECDLRVPPKARVARHNSGAALHSGVKILYELNMSFASRDVSPWICNGAGANWSSALVLRRREGGRKCAPAAKELSQCAS